MSKTLFSSTDSNSTSSCDTSRRCEQPIPADDLALIQENGLPVVPGAEFVTFNSDDTVTFTDRGKKLYRLAMLLNGLAPSHIDAVRNREDLRQVSLKFKRARALLAEIDIARLGGEVPLRIRALVQAVKQGATTEDVHRAMELCLLCDEAGENVIPFTRQKARLHG